jgi:hypothetical protein
MIKHTEEFKQEAVRTPAEHNRAIPLTTPRPDMAGRSIPPIAQQSFFKKRAKITPAVRDNHDRNLVSSIALLRQIDNSIGRMGELVEIMNAERRQFRCNWPAVGKFGKALNRCN